MRRPRNRLAGLLAALLASILLLTAGCGKSPAARIAPGDAAELIEFVADERLFIVMAFMVSAGFQEYTTGGHPLRAQIKSEIQLPRQLLDSSMGGKMVKDIPREAETVMMSLRFAVSRTGPPGFTPLPLPGAHPNVPALDRLLVDFHRDYGDKLDWERYKVIYEEELERIREPVMTSIAEILEVIPLAGPVETYRSKLHFNLLGYGWAHSVRQPDGHNHMVIYYRTDSLHSSFQQEFLRSIVEPQWAATADRVDALLRKLYVPVANTLPSHHRNRRAMAEESLVAALLHHFGGASLAKQQMMAEYMFARGYLLTPHFLAQVPAFLETGANFADWYPKFYEGVAPDDLIAAFRGLKPAYEESLAAVSNRGGLVIPVRGQATTPAFSPDGSSIVFSLTDPVERQEIWMVGAGGTEPVRLSSEAASYGAPRWSADGSRLAFWSGRAVDGCRRVHVGDPALGDIKLLTPDASNCSDPAWHPSGNSIAYVSDRSGVRQIYLLDLDTMQETPLTRGDRPSITPSWSPDGTRLVFSRLEGPTWNLFVVTPEGGERRLTDTGLDASHPRWSPDGSRILFASGVRNQLGTLALVNPDTGAITDLGLGELYPVAADWHPGGSRLVIASTPPVGASHLVVLGIE